MEDEDANRQPKISELVDALLRFQNEHGDLPVMIELPTGREVPASIDLWPGHDPLKRPAVLLTCEPGA